MIIVRGDPLYSGRDGFVQCKSDPWVYSKWQFKMGGDHLPDWANGGMRNKHYKVGSIASSEL